MDIFGNLKTNLSNEIIKAYKIPTLHLSRIVISVWHIYYIIYLLDGDNVSHHIVSLVTFWSSQPHKLCPHHHMLWDWLNTWTIAKKYILDLQLLFLQCFHHKAWQLCLISINIPLLALAWRSSFSLKWNNNSKLSIGNDIIGRLYI